MTRCGELLDIVSPDPDTVDEHARENLRKRLDRFHDLPEAYRWTPRPVRAGADRPRSDDTDTSPPKQVLPLMSHADEAERPVGNPGSQLSELVYRRGP